MYKRGEIFEVEFEECSFVTNELNLKYYKSLGFVKSFKKLRYFFDYVWVETNKNAHEGNFLIKFDKTYYKNSKIKETEKGQDTSELY